MKWPAIRDDIESTDTTDLTTRDLARRYGLTTKQMKNLLDHYGFLVGVDYQYSRRGPERRKA